MITRFFAFDATGAPLPGQALTWSCFYVAETGVAEVGPAFSAYGGGVYIADVPNGRTGIVDLGAGAVPRYIAMDNEVETGILELAGIHRKNSYADNMVYGDPLYPTAITSARLRVYDSKVNAEAHGATGLLFTYTITATYNAADGTNATFQMVRE